MSVMTRQTLRAPSGMDTTSDPVMMRPDRAQMLVNVDFADPGKTRQCWSLQMFAQMDVALDGLSFYYKLPSRNSLGAVTPSQDSLLAVGNGTLYEPFYTSLNPLKALMIPTANYLAGSGHSPGAFWPGKRLRSAAYAGETIFVQEGGLQPIRYTIRPVGSSLYTPGSGIFQLGMKAPAAPGVVDSGFAGNVNGAVQYRATFGDELGRESSPSAAVSITVTNKIVNVTVDRRWDTTNGYSDPQVLVYYLYRTLAGGSVFYRISSGNFNIGVNSILYQDNTTDANASLGAAAPLPSENDLPNPASIIAVHKEHVFLNDVSNSAVLQVSNLNSASQFALIAFVATDGARMQAVSDQGDKVTALVPFGSALGVWKQRGLWLLFGDTISDFTLRPMYEIGCIAPDSAERCEDVVMFLSDDGVYALSFEGAGGLKKVSAEIDGLLRILPRQTLENAFGRYVERQYWLWLDTMALVYDFDARGWGMAVFGWGDFNLNIPGLPPIEILPFVGDPAPSANPIVVPPLTSPPGTPPWNPPGTLPITDPGAPVPPTSPPGGPPSVGGPPFICPDGSLPIYNPATGLWECSIPAG